MNKWMSGWRNEWIESQMTKTDLVTGVGPSASSTTALGWFLTSEASLMCTDSIWSKFLLSRSWSWGGSETCCTAMLDKSGSGVIPSSSLSTWTTPTLSSILLKLSLSEFSCCSARFGSDDTFSSSTSDPWWSPVAVSNEGCLVWFVTIAASTGDLLGKCWGRSSFSSLWHSDPVAWLGIFSVRSSWSRNVGSSSFTIGESIFVDSANTAVSGSGLAGGAAFAFLARGFRTCN